MKACGLIVEYNPLHNGHLYHIEAARQESKSDCIIAVMSGSFLQRGEPAIIDKFHRTRSALQSGVDIVLELPYAYSVQNSDFFAQGAINILHSIGVDSICFGSESGNIQQFISSYHKLKEKKTDYQQLLSQNLQKGLSFPKASKLAFSLLNLTEQLDLGKPNNILGFSYVKTILDGQMKIKPLTIKRIQSHYHDQDLKGEITSATSIRKELLIENKLTTDLQATIPVATKESLLDYKEKTSLWHSWEDYFPFLKYRVSTMTREQLAEIHDVQEGLEHRILSTERRARSFEHWMTLIKTKRYTWTRLQRIFTHILTNTTKDEMNYLHGKAIPYLRILGFSPKGRAYLNQRKKEIKVPTITGLHRNQPALLSLEERASLAYYSILPPKTREIMVNQEKKLPIFLKEQMK